MLFNVFSNQTQHQPHLTTFQWAGLPFISLPIAHQWIVQNIDGHSVHFPIGVLVPSDDLQPPNEGDEDSAEVDNVTVTTDAGEEEEVDEVTDEVDSHPEEDQTTENNESREEIEDNDQSEDDSEAAVESVL